MAKWSCNLLHQHWVDTVHSACADLACCSNLINHLNTLAAKFSSWGELELSCASLWAWLTRRYRTSLLSCCLIDSSSERTNRLLWKRRLTLILGTHVLFHHWWLALAYWTTTLTKSISYCSYPLCIFNLLLFNFFSSWRSTCGWSGRSSCGCTLCIVVR